MNQSKILGLNTTQKTQNIVTNVTVVFTAVVLLNEVLKATIDFDIFGAIKGFFSGSKTEEEASDVAGLA